MNEEIIKEILELERETCKRFQNGDVEWSMDRFTEDVVLLNPGSKILIGKEHERAMLTTATQTKGLEMSWEPTDARVSDSGDMAYAYGIINIRTPEGTELSEKYVTIWRKIEGAWKLSLQIRNSNG